MPNSTNHMDPAPEVGGSHRSPDASSGNPPVPESLVRLGMLPPTGIPVPIEVRRRRRLRPRGRRRSLRARALVMAVGLAALMTAGFLALRYT